MKNNSDFTRKHACEKNDELELEIIDMSSDGDGIGKLDGYTLFVKDAMIGDLVRVKVIKTKKSFGYGRLLELIRPSEWRVEPKCQVARQCGGCQLQHCSYEKQLLWKEQKVANCLRRIGGLNVYTRAEVPEISDDAHTDDIVVMEPIMGMSNPYRYRNKAQFPVGYDRKGEIVSGFYAGRTHSIIPHTDCIIQNECNSEIMETVIRFMKKYDIKPYDEKTHCGVVRHILTRVGEVTGEVMVCVIINANQLCHSDELVKMLLECRLRAGDKTLTLKSVSININTEKTNRILGDKVKTIYGQDFIEDYIGEVKYRISPLSFYQVNPLQTKRLYETALEYADLQGGETVWDLYCGIGTISLFLAQKAAKVCGVEIVPQAIEDAGLNAELNGFDNTEFFVGAAEEVVPGQYEKSGGKLKADVVSLDPPRKGCDEKLLQTVIKMEPRKIVYVSCDPATLARDLRYLCERGYELKRVRACDMFGQSYHVETVCLLSKKP